MVSSVRDTQRSEWVIDCTYGLFSPLWVILDEFQVLDRFQKTYPFYVFFLGSYGNPHTAAHGHCDVKSLEFIGGHFAV